MKLFALAFASLLVFGAAAHAADGDDVDARLAAARNLLKIEKSDELQERRNDLLVDRAKRAFRHQAGVTDAEAAQFVSILHEELDRDAGKLVDLRAQYYADHFTLAELKEWTRIRQTDLGQKLSAMEPEYLRSMTAVDEAWVEGAMQRTQTRYRTAHTDGANHS